ncbi:hypothetical protein LBMAG27_06810 [Bacteroidota bacterium]|nr:hypothetical protein LBMAG27_06810 [Bacteroidota bacterium]
MRVLIICNDFPPLNSVGAQRPYSWFNYFNEYGIEPTVITKQWTAKIERAEDVLKNASSEKIIIDKSEKGTVIRVPIELVLPEKILLKFGADKKRIWRKMLSLFYKMFSFVSFSFDKHKRLYFEARKYLQHEKPDFILITGEPFILFKYGYLLHKEFGIPWVADFRDGWKLNHVTRHNRDMLNRFLQSWEFHFEKKYLRNCSFITAPDPYLGTALGKLHKKNFKVVYNGFEEFLNLDLPDQSATLTLTHNGTLTAGQQVEFLLQALLELHNEKKISSAEIQLNFIGLEYYPTQYSRVKNFSNTLNSYLKTTPRIARHEALKHNVESDFLIAFSEKNYQAIFAKVYDYLAAKKPILVLPNDNGLLSELINETKSGLTFQTIEALKKFLLEQLQEKKSGKNLFTISPDNEKVLSYTRKKQAEQLVKFLKENQKR